MSRPIRCRSAFEFSARQVFESMVDRAYLEARLARLGGKGAALLKLALDGPDGGPVEHAEYTLRQGIGREHLPATIQKVLTGDLLIERTESWRRTAPHSYDGTVAAAVLGAPGKVTGTLRLAGLADLADLPAGAAARADDGRPGSELTLVGSAQVSVPLIGGRIESVIAEQVQRLIGREHEFTLGWLGRDARR